MAAKSEVTYRIVAVQEEQPVRGNAMASGDDAVDKEVEDEILARLDRYDVWATVCVIAECEGFEGRAYLGCCSYADEADFKAEGGYYPQMKEEALDDLKATLKREVEKGNKAAKLLQELA